MRSTVTVAAVSVNTTPMDLKNNIANILAAYQEAVAAGADVVVTP